MEILFFLAALIAEIVGTIAGFGSSTIFLPLALQFFDFKTALTLVALFHIFGNIGRIGFFRHGIDTSVLLRFGLPSVLLTILGALLVSYVSQDLLKATLGLFLIFYSLASLWKEEIKIPETLPNAAVGGSLSGFLAGLIGTGGALRGAFLTAFGLPKERYIATSAAIALAVDITRIPIYLGQGFLASSLYWYVPVLLAIAFLGTFTAKQIVAKIPQKRFKKLVLIAILLIGIKFFYDLWLKV